MLINVFDSVSKMKKEINVNDFDSSVHFHINTRQSFDSSDIDVFNSSKDVVEVIEAPKVGRKKKEVVEETPMETPVETVEETIISE